MYKSWGIGLSKALGSKEERTSRMGNTVSEPRTQLTPRFAKSGSGASGSARRQADAANVPGGFTTVELLVAIIVGAIIFASAGVLISNYSHLNNRGQNLILANSFAEAKAEALRSISYAGLNDGTTDVTGELPANLSSPKSASMTISEPSPGLKQADITVDFSDQGINRSYTYRTYVGELGVGQ